MEAIFQVINAVLFAIAVAIAPAKQPVTRAVAQPGTDTGQQMAISAPAAVEAGNVKVDRENAHQVLSGNN